MLLYIGWGGFLGAVSRYGLSQFLAAQKPLQMFPWATFAENLLGSFLLGFFMILALEWLMVSPAVRMAVATGFLGSFTTFSTYVHEGLTLFLAGSRGMSLTYLIGSMFLGLLLTIAGMGLGRHLSTVVKKGKKKLEHEAD
ncbi:MAG: fluoride efflux transporter FluC [Bacillota bacterium]